MTERELITGLGKGDWRSYTILYRQFYERIRFFADKYVNDLDVAHELTIEAFIKLWQKRGDFETVQNIQAFLFITTKNACFNHIKQLKRRKLAHEEILYTSEKESENLLDEAVETELITLIFRESSSLTRTCRKIIQLHYGEGLTYKEIAQQMHISVENVRVQHANALNALRLLLKSKDLLFLVGICTFMLL
jgi:RNA polymerase sigma-70 factor (ECF subfamily)